MAYKVNYNFQKAERDRAKQAKKDAKMREKQAGRVGGESDEPVAGEAPEESLDDAAPVTPAPTHD